MGFYRLPPVPLGLVGASAGPAVIPIILDTYYGVGSPGADYVVFMLDPTGKTFLAVFDQFIELDYVLNENDEGVATLEIVFDPLAPWVWNKDNQLYIYRRAPFGSTYYLEDDAVWLLNKFNINWPKSRITIQAAHGNVLLSRWVIPYNEGNAYTYKLDEAGDMANAIVRENMGSLATDTTRNISTYLIVPVDVGVGQIVRLQFTNDSVMAACQKIIEASYQYGTWVGFRIRVVDVTVPSFRFEIYQTASNEDRRESAGHPLLFGPDYGTAELAEYEEDYSEEVNVAYVAGQGDEFIRPLASAIDAARLAQSPFRNEGFFSASSEAPDATSLQTVARQKLSENRPRKVLTLEPNDHLRQLYGIEWRLGTLVTGKAFGKTQDYRIDQVHVTFSQREIIEARLRSL